MKVGFFQKVLFGESIEEAVRREVFEETGVKAEIVCYIGKSEYSFNIPNNTVEKEVHWYLMKADSYFSKPQKEEYFLYSGYYKYIEAFHLLKFPNERNILKKAYDKYNQLNESYSRNNKYN